MYQYPIVSAASFSRVVYGTTESTGRTGVCTARWRVCPEYVSSLARNTHSWPSRYREPHAGEKANFQPYLTVRFTVVLEAQGYWCISNIDCANVCRNKFGLAYRTGDCISYNTDDRNCHCELWGSICKKIQTGLLLTTEKCAKDDDCTKFCTPQNYTGSCITTNVENNFHCNCMRYEERCQLGRTGQMVYLEDRGPFSDDGGKYL